MAKSPHFERASRSHSSMSLNLISVDRSSIALSVLLCGAIVADSGQRPRLLRARRERPCYCRTAEQRDELAPPMPNWRTFVDLHRAPLGGIALPDCCHKLRNAGQVFATNRETRKGCGEICLKQVWGRCLISKTVAKGIRIGMDLMLYDYRHWLEYDSV